MGLEKDVLEHGSGLAAFGQGHQHPQSEMIVDDHLADVEDVHAGGGQHAREHGGDARPVLAVGMDEYDFAHARPLVTKWRILAQFFGRLKAVSQLRIDKI